MNSRFTVGQRIGLGFSLLIVSTLAAFILTDSTITESEKINNDINNVYTPSVANLEELNLMTIRSKNYISNWVFVQSRNDDDSKTALRVLLKNKYPKLKDRISVISKEWSKNEVEDIKFIFTEIDTLINYYQSIMDQLNSFESYEDPSVKLLINPQIEENGEVDVLSKRIFRNLEKAIAVQQGNAKREIKKMNQKFSFLRNAVRYLGFALVLGGILIALFTVNSIVKPVQFVRNILLKMGRGIVPEEIPQSRNDEIGDMTKALNILINTTKRTTHFAEEVGAGNFESHYESLGEEDLLGNTLLKMRVQLGENERILEQKVIERTEEVVRQKEEIALQREKMEILFEQQTDSIKYAKRLQDAILPPRAFVQKVLPNSFTIFKPKDIVSGDFYWVEKKGTRVFFSAVDCTGHGVPGAFMSLIGHNILKQSLALSEHPTPSTLLDDLSKGIVATLHQGRTENTTKDGMDLTLCAIDFEKKTLEFAGAFNPLFFIRQGKLEEIRVDKMSIGSFVADDVNKYTNFTKDLLPGDAIYILTDGYCDQFGGPKGKKFMASRFRDLLLSIQDKTMDEQRKIISITIDEWRGHEEQIDDILLMGVTIT